MHLVDIAMCYPARIALAGGGLRYAGQFSGLLVLPQHRLLRSVVLTCSCRHPADARRPANLVHALRLAESALKTRVPITEVGHVHRMSVGN